MNANPGKREHPNPCPACGGSGRQPCASCGGMGVRAVTVTREVNRFGRPVVETKHEYQNCTGCGGLCRRRCESCGGTGMRH